MASLPAKMRTWPRSVGRRRAEGHRAVAEQHEPGDAFGRFDDEDVAGGQLQLEVHRPDHEAARRELALGVQGEAMQAVDGRQPIEADDAPRRAEPFNVVVHVAPRGRRMSSIHV
jgi:hypothetical protein